MEDIGNIDATLFFMAHRFVGDCGSRYYLRGVCIEPCPDGGVYMVATDGHTMGVAYDPDGSINEQCIISASTEQQPCNTGRKTVVEGECGGEHVRWGEGSWPWWNGERLQLKRLETGHVLGLHASATEAHPISLVCINAKFAPWQKAVPWEVFRGPGKPTGLRGVITSKVMAKVCFSSDDYPEPLTFYQGDDPDMPAIFLPYSHPNFFALVMPVQGIHRAKAQPWMRALAEANTPSGGKEAG